MVHLLFEFCEIIKEDDIEVVSHPNIPMAPILSIKELKYSIIKNNQTFKILIWLKMSRIENVYKV